MDGVVCTFCKNKLINDFFAELPFGRYEGFQCIVGANISGAQNIHIKVATRKIKVQLVK